MPGRRPLYRDAVITELPPDGHAGLWYDKLCDRWSVNGRHWSLTTGRESRSSPKLDWISTVTARGGVGDRDLLSQYAERLTALALARGGDIDVMVATSRFVTGLGRSHPLDNGFAWHPTLGTPYLPGSSLKGLARAWAEDEESAGAEAERLLGAPGRVGEVSCLDAVPLDPVRLEADVITRHYGGWHESKPPADWRSPTPVPFLVAAAGTALLVAVMPHGPMPAEGQETVRGWLCQALEHSGGGAKTTVGYGRFQVDPRRRAEVLERVHHAQAVHERERAMSTPEGRWRVAVHGAGEEAVLELVRVHLEAEPLTDREERAAFARQVNETGFPASWRRGEPAQPVTKVGRKKLKERARLIGDVLQEQPQYGGAASG